MKQKSGWLGLPALLWLVLVFGMYYLGHKPFTPGVAFSLGRAMGQFLIAAAILSLAGGLGRRVLPDFGMPPLTQLALQAGLGLGIFSLFILLVASSVGFSRMFAWAGLGLAGFLLRREVFAWWRAAAGLRAIWGKGGRYGKAVALGSGLILFFTLSIALAPAVKFDALTYHLALPHQYLNRGRLAYLPQNIFWGMPQLGEMLYLWGIALGGDQAAAVLGWAVGWLVLVGLWDYACRRLGVGAAWTVIASLLAGYTIASELSWAYIDWFTILFGFAVLVTLQAWLDSGDGRKLLLAGVFAGFAFGSKYSAGSLLLAGGIVAALGSFARTGWRRALANSAIFLSPGLAVMAPWLVKNLLAAGNPLYPFLYPSGAMDALRLELYQGLPVWGDWQMVLLLPWEATVNGHEGAPGFSASIGPLLLGLALVGVAGLAFRFDRKLPRLRLAAWLAGLGLLGWALAGRFSGYLIQTRLYLGFFPALALLAGGGQRTLARLQLPGVRLGKVAASLAILALALNVLQVGLDMFAKDAPGFLLGLRSEGEYLNTNLGGYAPAMQAINRLAPADRVLMLWEPRSLYCLPRCYPDEILDRWQREWNVRGDASQILAGWRGEGYAYLLVNHAGADFVRQDDTRYPLEAWRVLDDLLASLPRVGDFGGGYALYQLTP